MLDDHRWLHESDEHESKSRRAGGRSAWLPWRRSSPMVSADAAAFTLPGGVAHP
jgi:hypothetical protein